MLFNSTVFITAFLPISLCLYFLSAQFGGPLLARVSLMLASLFFYGWWNWSYLLLILASIGLNYSVNLFLDTPDPRARRMWLTLGIVANLAVLGYFKYVNFFIDTVNSLFQTNVLFEKVFLPLAISFFTFQQIAFLVERYQSRLPQTSFVNYALAVVFFPHLIAGPIVHYSELMPQFEDRRRYRFDPDLFATGLTIFLLGLAKKVLLADQFATYADVAFAGAAEGASLSFFEGWFGALAYTLQLYFDFSGYSDMAIGLALLFGIELPLNFNSPYKAFSIIDFWRRWHITLSSFLRDYLYIPLGGGRRGAARRYGNLLATMTLGGLWHGAGWTFVLWGLLHGGYLVINHLWRGLWAPGDRAGPPTWPGRIMGIALTFLAVVVAWVLFRAIDLAAAGQIYQAMLGVHGIAMPDRLVALLPPLKGWVIPVDHLPYLANGGGGLRFLEFSLLLALGLAVVFLMPNIYQMRRWLRLGLVGLAFAFVVQRVFFAMTPSPFLYFQF